MPISKTGEIRWPQLLLVYLFQNIFHLGVWNTKFWDDWSMYGDISNLKAIEQACPVDRCGKIPFTYLWEQPILEVGSWLLRLLVIISFGIAGWAFWRILNHLRFLSQAQCSIATILFLLLPINGARVSLVTARASFALCLFLIGLLLLTSRRLFTTFLGVALVLCSAFQPSIQFFLIAVPALLFSRDLAAGLWVGRRTVVLTVTLGVGAALLRYFIPEILIDAGVVAEPVGYNLIKLPSLIRAVLVCGILGLPFMVDLARPVLTKPKAELRTNQFRIGLFLLAAGTFPYMAVGHFATLTEWVVVFLPDLSAWDSRYQLLQGPGYALILASLAQFVRERWRHYFVNSLIWINILLGVTIFSVYYVDSQKQQNVIAQLQQRRQEFAEVEYIQFVDRAVDLNARGRKQRDHEWEGIVFESLGHQAVIWTSELSSPTIGCEGAVVGKRVTIRKISGRLRIMLTRAQAVSIEIDDLIACR